MLPTGAAGPGGERPAPLTPPPFPQHALPGKTTSRTLLPFAFGWARAPSCRASPVVPRRLKAAKRVGKKMRNKKRRPGRAPPLQPHKPAHTPETADLLATQPAGNHGSRDRPDTTGRPQRRGSVNAGRKQGRGEAPPPRQQHSHRALCRASGPLSAGGPGHRRPAAAPETFPPAARVPQLRAEEGGRNFNTQRDGTGGAPPPRPAATSGDSRHRAPRPTGRGRGKAARPTERSPEAPPTHQAQVGSRERGAATSANWAHHPRSSRGRAGESPVRAPRNTARPGRVRPTGCQPPHQTDSRKPSPRRAGGRLKAGRERNEAPPPRATTGFSLRPPCTESAAARVGGGNTLTARSLSLHPT